MSKINFSGKNKIWGTQKHFGALPQNPPPVATNLGVIIALEVVYKFLNVELHRFMLVNSPIAKTPAEYTTMQLWGKKFLLKMYCINVSDEL